MPTSVWRTLLATTIVLAIVAGALWFALARTDTHPEEDPETDVALLPSDEETRGTETSTPTTTGQTPTPMKKEAVTGPEQVAVAFMDAYPGDVAGLADPTFLASLDGVDASLLEQVTDPSLEQVDQATDEVYERHAFTVTGTYQGERVPVYSIVVARPIEPGEVGSASESDLPFQVHSFDWAADMLGDENTPGPAAGVPAPISAEQRSDLLNRTRTNVIAQVLTVDPDESAEQRQSRLDGLIVEPTDVAPPMSRSGRYAMTTEILSQAYSTEPGGPITITYSGTWVDPYDPTYNGSWSLTATITRDSDGRLIVRSVERPRDR